MKKKELTRRHKDFIISVLNKKAKKDISSIQAYPPEELRIPFRPSDELKQFWYFYDLFNGDKYEILRNMKEEGTIVTNQEMYDSLYKSMIYFKEHHTLIKKKQKEDEEKYRNTTLVEINEIINILLN